MIPYSVLDLAPIAEGRDAAASFAHSADLAKHAENWGYNRFWLAEHHNMPGIASAATSVVIGHVAAATKTIRVGSGGVMLPNHSPLVIAEQFGTLATLHPGRIDCGLGRAPGTDMATARALRRSKDMNDQFPQDVVELMTYFADAEPGQRIKAVPGEGTHVPVWILGSSLYGAQLAAHLGLPYAFASHFAPDALEHAAQVYRDMFQPSQHLKAPYFMLACNVYAAETEREARILMSSHQQSFARLRTGTPGPMPKPVENIEELLDAGVLSMVNHALSVSACGSPSMVKIQLEAMIERYRPDEIIINGSIHDHAKRLRSFEIAANAMKSLGQAQAAE